MKRLLGALLPIFLVMVLTACQSQPLFSATGTWTGVVYDQGSVPVRLVIQDSGGRISGEGYVTLDRMRYFGTLSGTRTGYSATITNRASDGSGYLRYTGAFRANTFSGTVTLYNANTGRSITANFDVRR